MSSTQEVGDIFGAGKGSAHAMLRSPTVLIVSVGLWGMNIFFFRLFGINYKYVLNYDLMNLEHNNNNNNNNNNNQDDYYNDDDDDSSDQQQQQQTMIPLIPMSKKSTPPPPQAQQQQKHSSNPSTSSLAHIIQQQKQKQHNHHHHRVPSGNTKTTTGTSSSQSLPLTNASLSQYDSSTHHHHHHYHASIDWYKLVLFSMALLLLLRVISYYWMDYLGRDVLGAVFGFYGIVLLYITLPLQSNRWLRRAFVIVLQRSFELVNPRCYYCLNDNNNSRYNNNTTTTTSTTAAANNNNASGIGGTASGGIGVGTNAGGHPSGGGGGGGGIGNGGLPRPIPFIDVFYADAMCSLSKVFFDWGMLLHMASHYPNPVPPSMHNIIIPSLFAAVPFVIRARQCLLMHTIGRMKNDPKRYQHFANAIKYSTSIFPLCLSAYQKTIGKEAAEELEHLLILLLTVNALYALFWDIVMDWGMMQKPVEVVSRSASCVGGGSNDNNNINNSNNLQLSNENNSNNSSSNSSSNKKKDSCVRHALLRPRLRFGFTMSFLILLADSILRFSWLLRFAPNLFPSPDAFILCTQFLEVFRRAIWNLLRIEWEHIKQKEKQLKARDSLSDHEDEDYDYDYYLDNNNNNIINNNDGMMDDIDDSFSMIMNKSKRDDTITTSVVTNTNINSMNSSNITITNTSNKPPTSSSSSTATSLLKKIGLTPTKQPMERANSMSASSTSSLPPNPPPNKAGKVAIA